MLMRHRCQVNKVCSESLPMPASAIQIFQDILGAVRSSVLFYSSRRATIGLTLIARRAGM
jgi:hypothetical protein